MAGLSFAAACAAIAIHLCLLLSPSSSGRCVSDSEPDSYRTAYHFQPARNWQSDANGPMCYMGVYHIFYQYNPHNASWGNGTLSWGHSVSLDLVNWDALDNALDPESPFDANGCWSGSATILTDGTPVLLYTGIDGARNQVQNVAFPKNALDPHLREWVKPSFNPIIPLPADVRSRRFRDPSTPWLGRDGLWRVAVSAQIKNSAASTLIYRSSDFRRWERNAEPLFSSGTAGMVESPDLFPVAEPGVKNGLDLAPSNAEARHVLKVSVMDTSQDYYAFGRYDDAEDTFEASGASKNCRKWHRIDHGHVYASKSFYDAAKKRRVLWAWANESDAERDYVARGWAGVQIVPRKIWLDDEGKQLLQWPIDEIETLRRKRVGLLVAEVEAGGTEEITGIVSSQADVQVVFEIPNLEEAETFKTEWLFDPQRLCREKGASVPGGVGPFGLHVLASGDMQEYTSVFFRIFKLDGKYKVLMCTDPRRSTARANVYKSPYGGFVDMDIEDTGSSIALRTLIDHSIVESFGDGGRTCITARVYAETSCNHLYVFNNGADAVRVSELDAWEMATAKIN